MKSIFIVLMIIMIGQFAYAGEANFDINRIRKTIKEAELFDGRKVDFKKDVERFQLFENKIDYIELRSGEVVDSSDINTIRYVDPYGMILKATGVDGGG